MPNEAKEHAGDAPSRRARNGHKLLNAFADCGQQNRQWAGRLVTKAGTIQHNLRPMQ